MQKDRFSAIHTIKYSAAGTPEHYSIGDMIIWATLPYAIWQLSYHFLITVRKRSKILAGRPTSFTWLRKSYRGNILGKFVLSFPESWQETIFMFVQYTYAVLTMLPCPIWFWYRWASASFMLLAFSWASWNGATYYIDVFGKRMEKELEALRKEIARISKSPDIAGQDGTGNGVGSPLSTPAGPLAMDGTGAVGNTSAFDLGPAAQPSNILSGDSGLHKHSSSMDAIPTFDATTASTKSDDHFDGSAQTSGVDFKRTLDGGLELSDDAPSTPNGQIKGKKDE